MCALVCACVCTCIHIYTYQDEPHAIDIILSPDFFFCVCTCIHIYTYQDEPHAIDIILSPVSLVDKLFGRGVSRVTRRFVVVVTDALADAHGGGRPKVNQSNFAVRDENVKGLDVTVRHS